MVSLFPKTKNIQNKKFFNFYSICLWKVIFAQEKIIYKFSNHTLAEAEKFVSYTGLRFALTPENVDYIVWFELLFKDIKSIDLMIDRFGIIYSGL